MIWTDRVLGISRSSRLQRHRLEVMKATASVCVWILTQGTWLVSQNLFVPISRFVCLSNYFLPSIVLQYDLKPKIATGNKVGLNGVCQKIWQPSIRQPTCSVKRTTDKMRLGVGTIMSVYFRIFQFSEVFQADVFVQNVFFVRNVCICGSEMYPKYTVTLSVWCYKAPVKIDTLFNYKRAGRQSLPIRSSYFSLRDGVPYSS